MRFAAFCAALAAVFVPGASAVGGAAFTSINEAVDDTGHCQNSAINCNIYDGKQFVWLNGGPQANGLEPDGQYFFAVLVPGGQPDPNDGGAKNLSDDFDVYGNRTFTVSSGEVSAYGGTHDLDSGAGAAGSRLNTPDDAVPFIRLAPYADTTNPGGVYILAICYLGASGTAYPVDPKDCKYDAFKVKESETNPASDLTVLKDAAGSFDRSFQWLIDKTVDKTTVKLIGGGSAVFNYTVSVTHDAGTDSNWVVSGSITVFNPNEDEVTGVDVTDAVDNGGTCSVTGGSGVTIPALDSSTFSYSCTYGSAPGNGKNTATATWPDQTLATAGELKGGSADFTVPFTFPSDPANLTDECVSVSDSYAGSLGTACVGEANPKAFTYSRTIAAPAVGTCPTYDNTATFTTNDTGASGSDSQTVTVCNYNAPLTPGYWKNHLNFDSKHPSDPYTATFLPQSLNGYVVNTTAKATAVFNAMNCSNTGSNSQMNQNAIGCLAGHLLAAKLNFANTADPCIATAISAADAFLVTIPYIGPTGNYSGIGTTKRNQAIALKNPLDKFNNGGGC